MGVSLFSILDRCPTSSLDERLDWGTPDSWDSESPDSEPSATIGGDYSRPTSVDEGKLESRAWAEVSRRSLRRWIQENPY